MLADTKQGPFSQTTDCVQLHEVQGAICQRQQMIYTDPCSGRPLLPPRVVRVGPVGRVYGQASVARAIAATSIDEGVETDYDEESEALKEASTGQTVASTTVGQEGVGGLARSDIYGCFGRVGLQNQPLASYPSNSFDSNIELDVISNVSSSPSGSITASNMSTEMAEAAECPGEGVEEPDAPDDQKDQRAFVEFREGRRASDGLVVRGVMEFQQHLKKSMKTRGVAELRKELEKLRLEAAGDSEMKHRARPGRFLDVRSMQQRSLEETVSGFRGPNLVIKRTSLPVVGTLTFQKRIALRPGGPWYDGSHSGGYAQDVDAVRTSAVVAQHVPSYKPIKSQPLHVLPYCTSPSRHLWPLQNPVKTPTHQLPHQLPLQERPDEGARFGLLSSHFPMKKDERPCAQSVTNPPSLRSVSPCFLQREIPPGFLTCPSSELFPVSSAAHALKDNHFVPTCRSQDSLLEFTSKVDALQSRDSSSLGALLKHPTYSNTLATMSTTEAPEPDATRRHMVRRTLFKMAQQQTCGDDGDGDELSLEETADAERSGGAKNDPTTSMDFS